MANMIDSFLRGINFPVILWILSKKSTHGYELAKEFKRLTGRKLKPSTVYPLLHLLEREGFVASEWVKKGQKNIKFYSLTEKGEKLLAKVYELFSKPIKEAICDLLEG